MNPPGTTNLVVPLREAAPCSSAGRQNNIYNKRTVGLLNSPWSSSKNVFLNKTFEVVSRPEFAQNHESGLRSDWGPVVLCDFSKSRFRKSPCDLKICIGDSARTTHHTNPGKNQPPPSPPPPFSKMRTFF
jgi:hypothetical protein